VAPAHDASGEGRLIMDAARAFDASWPDCNFHFRRGWAEPPPQKRERRPAGGTTGPAKTQGDDDTAEDSLLLRLSQRARCLDQAADAELLLGHHALAERLSRLAADLREVSA
jgi:hypothetical protein